MQLIFDIGMYDGSDTEYYLSEGYRVIAIEANPSLIERAEIQFKEKVSSGQLVLVNRAICKDPGETITLTICGSDLGSSSIFEERLQNRLGSYNVEGITIAELIEKYGFPYFMKIDIEGADRYCILPLDKERRPQYISFEAGDDIEELIHHLEKIGFTKFKIINQATFIELNKQLSLIYRVKCKIIYLLGGEIPVFNERYPTYVWRHMHAFLLGHSAGPAPWISDGGWQNSSELLSRWKSASAKNRLPYWYDVHAM